MWQYSCPQTNPSDIRVRIPPVDMRTSPGRSSRLVRSSEGAPFHRSNEYTDISGYPHVSAVDMTPQNSDSGYSSGASPMSPLGYYLPSPGIDLNRDPNSTGYSQYSPQPSSSSQVHNTPRPQAASQGYYNYNGDGHYSRVEHAYYGDRSYLDGSGGDVVSINLETSQENSVQPSRSTKTQKPSKDKPYHCLEAGCDGRFTRPFDLSRHLKTTHLSGRRIDCPEGWCGRAGQPERGEKGGFTRVDHFYEHVKKVHRKEVIKDSNGNMFVKNSDGRLSEARWTNPSKSHR